MIIHVSTCSQSRLRNAIEAVEFICLVRSAVVLPVNDRLASLCIVVGGTVSGIFAATDAGVVGVGLNELDVVGVSVC